MTDITELAQSLKRRAASANEFGESLYVKADDVLALVEALEREVAMREQNLAIKLHMSERISELESRTVTVKLPEPFKLAKSSSGLTYYYADEVNEALTAQGIKWEAE
ncbi:hypothetical protein [Klebsiella aerogenes]|uniref:hypothetical protein n=1 Tax=Klebsiella aerogenes TaxID=548 RepID=UPI0027FD8097|nr:hypothetical protein [Klebsiella aerogenes]